MMTRWTAPDPAKLPDWRASMLDHLTSKTANATMHAAINSGHSTLVPMIPGLHAAPGAISAELLNRSEEHRLQSADLYFATADMTALALAAAQTPPTEAVTLKRPPSPAGLVVFAEPIGGYEQDAAQALAGTPAYLPGARAIVTTPIVAASWSPWSPQSVTTDHGRVTWLYKGGGQTRLIPDNFRGIWVTFYSPRGIFSGLTPDTPVGVMADGSVMTAAHIEHRRTNGGPLLSWDNEMLMKEGGHFDTPKPDTNAAWSIALYTSWQLMSQTSNTRWIESEDLPRSRSGIKRDARQGITGSSTVRIIRVHPNHRPPRPAAEQDARNSTGRREPQWSCRWPVAPYRRNTCLNTRAHADGGCTHEDRIVPFHIKGPDDKPLRTRDTVRLWDQMP